MRKALISLAALGLTAPAAVFAQSVWVPSGNLGIWYSYADQKVRDSDTTPDGSGVGVSGQLNLPLGLPFNVFVDGLYQFNGEDHPGTFSGGTEYLGMSLREQARAGGGVQTFVPGLPLTVFGKIDYVHYRFRDPAGNDSFGDPSLHDNDDGAGYFAGFRTTNRGVQVYGQGGYLDLSDSHGQEYKVGLAVPLGPIYRRHASAELFAEYDWTRLHGNGGDSDTATNSLPGLMYDYHVGVRFPFL